MSFVISDNDQVSSLIQSHREIRLAWETCAAQFAKDEALIIDKTHNEIADEAMTECKSHEVEMSDVYRSLIKHGGSNSDQMMDNIFGKVYEDVRDHAVGVVFKVRGSRCDRDYAPQNCPP